MTIKEMAQDKYNTFISVESECYLQLLSDENKHKVVGFVVNNNTGTLENETTTICPVVIWTGVPTEYVIFPEINIDSELPF